jgi:hypothetical protein
MDVVACENMDGTWKPSMSGNWQPNLSGNWKPSMGGNWRQGLGGRWYPNMSGTWKESGMGSDRQQMGNRADFGAFNLNSIFSNISTAAKKGVQKAQDEFIVRTASHVVNDPRVQAAAQRSGMQNAIDQANQSLLSAYDTTAQKLKVSQDTAKMIVLGAGGLLAVVVAYKIYKMVK